MSDKKDDKTKKEEDRRKAERFAWLGPLLERRKAEADPLDDDGRSEELEEINDRD